MSSSGTTPRRRTRGSVRAVRSRLGSLLSRYVVDAAACVLAVVTLVEDLVSPTATLSDVRYDRGPEIVIVPVVLATTALVLARRRLGVVAPMIALALFGLSSLPARAWLPSSGSAYLSVILVAATIGYLGMAGRSGVAGLALIWAVAAFAVARQPDRSWGTLVFVSLTLSIAWFVGMLVRRPIETARAAEERARRLEEEQTRSAESAVAQERQRIARELHDVIAHSVSVMTVQAGAVRRLLLPEQEKEREALLSVESTGRQALTEMRRLVGLLKEDSVMPLYAPQPSMKTLDVLVGTVREAGLPVELSVQGEQRELAPGVDLAAYRVVQEALTNALKYAGPARAWVSVEWAGDQLVLQVENDGRSNANGEGGGHGLVGMKERVAVVGGTLESGPRAGGGFVVTARIPTGGAA
jgi:signal transduction histidine kinase